MKINNQNVKAPQLQGFTITPFEISKTITMASGRTVKEVVAVKNKFSLAYERLMYSDYEVFYDAFISGEPVAFTYLDNDVEISTVAYITSVPRGIYQEKSIVSHGIAITLEEV